MAKQSGTQADYFEGKNLFIVNLDLSISFSATKPV